MIKSLVLALVLFLNNYRSNMNTHAVMSPDGKSYGPPGVIDKDCDFRKSKWMQDKLFMLQSARISFIDKEELAKEVLDLLDLDEAIKLGVNVISASLTGDWNFDIQS